MVAEPNSSAEELAAASASERVRPLPIDDFRALNRAGEGVSSEQLLHLLEYSVLAPSTHNSVPQAYRLNAEYARVELCLRRQYVMPASDQRGEQALISVGCALENLIVAARTYALTCSWRPAPELSWDRLGHSSKPVVTSVASVEFAPRQFVQDERPPNQVLRSMIERRTVRAEFEAGEPLAPELRAQLAACFLEAGARVRLDIFEAPAEKFAWGKLDEAATKHKLEEAAFRQELGRSLLSNDDTESVRGMRGREFGLDDRLTRQLSAELRGDVAMPVDRLAFLARAGLHGLSRASSVCVLSSL
ncbi:MAG TPA: hypothetical protein VG963_20535, partial [Polyangiaceae bacterium]|nr:hypothetical protein [Polyangiaceae bacterium]